MYIVHQTVVCFMFLYFFTQWGIFSSALFKQCFLSLCFFLLSSFIFTPTGTDTVFYPLTPLFIYDCIYACCWHEHPVIAELISLVFGVIGYHIYSVRGTAWKVTQHIFEMCLFLGEITLYCSFCKWQTRLSDLPVLMLMDYLHLTAMPHYYDSITLDFLRIHWC